MKQLNLRERSSPCSRKKNAFFMQEFVLIKLSQKICKAEIVQCKTVTYSQTCDKNYHKGPVKSGLNYQVVSWSQESGLSTQVWPYYPVYIWKDWSLNTGLTNRHVRVVCVCMYMFTSQLPISKQSSTCTYLYIKIGYTYFITIILPYHTWCLRRYKYLQKFSFLTNKTLKGQSQIKNDP